MTLVYIFFFLFGAVIGSFLNVCIVRLPQDQSVVRPRSRCPNCGMLIKAYDNIPIVSFLLLRGRCRDCKKRISFLYPTVEFLTGLVFVACVWVFGLTWLTLKAASLGCGLVVLICTDIKFRLLPNEITLYGILVGLGFSIFVPLRDRSLEVFFVLLSFVTRRAEVLIPYGDLSILNSFAGALFGGGILFLVGEIYFRLRHIEGMGMGDVKMMAMVGSFLGVKLTFFTIMFGSMLGTVFGIVAILQQQKDLRYELPFGTFLGSAAMVLALFGGPILQFMFP
jgi:leader peptidase (prepilin peptidase)/N-methyltransferase